MNTTDTADTVHAPARDDWRRWLERNCATSGPVWLVLRHKASATPSVRYHEAIEEALCFGWIDSQARSRDDESSYLRFSRRGPRSTWSKTNRERAERLIAEGRMTPHGQEAIDRAKATGRWTGQRSGT